MTLSTKLRILVAANDVSQKELAEYCNIQQAALNTYMRGRSHPPPKVLLKMAEFFQISTDFLLKDKYSLQFIYKNQPEPLIAEPSPHYLTNLPEDIKDLFNSILILVKDPQKKEQLQGFIKSLKQD